LQRYWNLSTGQLTQCDFLTGGCGGSPELTYPFIHVKNVGGLQTAADYPFTSFDGVTGNCSENPHKGVVTVNNFTKISSSEISVAAYVQNLGPVAVVVDASLWNTYIGGLMTVCPNKKINHAVQAVGIDMRNGYWKIRNSWGTNWGERGYIRIKYGVGLCGLGTEGVVSNVVLANIPTAAPTAFPSLRPTTKPSLTPTRSPSFSPTRIPSIVPTNTPTNQPSFTRVPTRAPTTTIPPSSRAPSFSSAPTTRTPTSTRAPTLTRAPSRRRHNAHSLLVEANQSKLRSEAITSTLTQRPSVVPTRIPTRKPTRAPSRPSTAPTTLSTSRSPTRVPSVLSTVSTRSPTSNSLTSGIMTVSPTVQVYVPPQHCMVSFLFIRTDSVFIFLFCYNSRIIVQTI
jgi:hypothetical protein